MLMLASAILLAISFYLLLEQSVIRRVFGLVLFGSTINLILLVCGRLHSVQPAFVSGHGTELANPLPQALILTAIVIGFGLLAFLCALLKQVLGAKN